MDSREENQSNGDSKFLLYRRSRLCDYNKDTLSEEGTDPYIRFQYPNGQNALGLSPSYEDQEEEFIITKKCIYTYGKPSSTKVVRLILTNLFEFICVINLGILFYTIYLFFD
ncbi:hypothetical protein WA158_001016 [Blastocystis sp. Blastoise]